MRLYALVLSISALVIQVEAANFFISPSGDDQDSGLDEVHPFRRIETAIAKANAGDTIWLLPGTYPGNIALREKSGEVDRPIVISSHSTDPLNFAIIDSAVEPTNNAEGPGFDIRNSSWIVLLHLVFEHSWAYVVDIRNSSYVTVRGCHFSTGKRIVYPRENGTHHVLVEHCFVKHPEKVWKGWDWADLHHGNVSFYNGGLMHPAESGGGHVMRRNIIHNMFNGFRTRPSRINEDANLEIYENQMFNIRDNDFEPEGWAWNIHYYRNVHHNIHKAYSIDDVKGGGIYIYANTYNQSKDAYALDEVSGIFKYKNGPLTLPCYAFNNSYYTEARVLKDGESTNHLLKHFNNAYYFFQGSNRFVVDEWQQGFEFDYDCINQFWPAVITLNNQEKNGLENADPLFSNALDGDFTLKQESPCIDAGRIMQLDEFNWTQLYLGEGPDIGAMEGLQSADGPPFRFIPPLNGSLYQERPRVSKYLLDGYSLRLFFTVPLDTTDIKMEDLEIYSSGETVDITGILFSPDAFMIELLLQSNASRQNTSMNFSRKPLGKNGLPVTTWASAIPIGKQIQEAPDLSVISASTTSLRNTSKPDLSTIYPNPIGQNEHSLFLRFSSPAAVAPVLSIYTMQGEFVLDLRTHELEEGIYRGDLQSKPLPKGVYLVQVVQKKKSATKKLIVQ